MQHGLISIMLSKRIPRNKFNQGSEKSVQQKQVFVERNRRQHKWKDIPFSWIRRIILLKSVYYSKLSIDSTQTL